MNNAGDDGNDWSALAREASTSSGSGGTKRKFAGAWGRRGAKKFRTSRGKKKSPIKRTAGRAGASAKKARGGSSANLLPRPTPQF